ncbi:hypothetical protein C8R46DRAFT_989342 [Mycena filopes]|nr:hypothetical protein C8R46DRAFT_989342 [Mycena filopes]
MPKAKPASARAPQKDQTLLRLLNGEKRVLIPRPKTYKAAIEAAHRHFPAIKAEDMVLQTKDLDICEGELYDIASESWELMVDSLTSISVIERHECPQDDEPVALDAPASSASSEVGVKPAVRKTAAVDPPSNTSSDKLALNCVLQEGAGTVTLSVKASTTFARILPRLAEKKGLKKDRFYLLYGGKRIKVTDTTQSLDMEDGDAIEVHQLMQRRTAKPIIYLYSPVEINATVALTLTSDQSFSAIYPVVPTKFPSSNVGQRIEWNVRTHLNGDLTETNTGLDVAYLFWEADANHGIPASPPASPVLENFETPKSLSPLEDDLSPADSILIPVAKITPYLDKVLLALGLHTEARTSFITYWLPSFLKHKYVALRFVPQAVYEASAALDITPTPDVVTRVFMLFTGIADDALGGWSDASAGDDGERWIKVVGVDVERAADVKLFRVLEWGGREVLK